MLAASIIKSFEYKPVRKGIPVRARLPMIKHEDVNGMSFAGPPIFQMFCSSFRLWIIDPDI